MATRKVRDVVVISRKQKPRVWECASRFLHVLELYLAEAISDSVDNVTSPAITVSPVGVFVCLATLTALSF